MKQTFENVAKVPIGGKQPGQKFTLVMVDGQISDAYWRRRHAEGAIAAVSSEKSQTALDEPAKKKGKN